MKRVLLALVMMGVMSSCTPEKVLEPPFVQLTTKVSVIPAANQIEVGRTTVLVVRVLDQRDSVMAGQAVVWSSSHPSIATVANGTVTGVSKGTVVITAAVAGKTASATVYVVEASVFSITFTSSLPSVFYVGAVTQAIVAVRDSLNNMLPLYAVTWASSDTAVMSVTQLGLITAKRAGTSVITAAAAGKTVSQTVTSTLVPVANVSLAASALVVGRSVTITPTLTNANDAALTLTQRSLSWASTNSSVATISSAGVLLGRAVGTTTITCVIESKVGLLVVSVSELGIQYIIVTPDSVSMMVDSTKQFNAIAYDADSAIVTVVELNGRTIAWSVADTAKAKVTTNSVSTTVAASGGLVRGYAAGSTTVKAAIGTVNKTSKVIVVAP